ncbi:MAG TPA: chorismate pyruvate-lyase family protein [Pseudomonadales bacterium]|nr:chorismate pyruvate-lyase family protein [Pseudomonadales bacterium]
MKHFFQSKAYIAEGYIINSQQQKFDLRNLPPILRVLLSTDGTVTKTLEAYFWEAIQVLNVQQELIQLDHARDFLPSQAGEWLLQRSVELLGQQSGRCYTEAHSLIRLHVLPEEIRLQLQSGQIGIGELLREKQLESYRQLVDLGQYDKGRIFRTYQIIINHQPALLVTEIFPLACYQA